MKKLVIKTIAMIAVMTCMVSSLAGCSTSKEISKVDEIKEKGVLVMGTSSGYPPYEFVSMDNHGEVIGIDVELAKAVADELGMELQVQDMAFGELVTALTEDKIDIAIAGMPETEQRAEVIDFSKVYMNDEQSIIVKSEHVSQYTSLDDLSGKLVGVEQGSSSESVANAEISNINTVSLALVSDVFLELLNGKVDAVVTGKVVGQQYILANEGLQILDGIKFENKDKPASCGIAKGNDAFVELVNKVIDENQNNGNFDKWIDKYSETASKEAGLTSN